MPDLCHTDESALPLLTQTCSAPDVLRWFLLAQVCEKEKLLSERNQLKVCMAELWQNLSFLSQQVCREVQGGQTPPASASIDLTSGPPSPSSDEASGRPRSPASRHGRAPRPSDSGPARAGQKDDGPSAVQVSNLGQETPERPLVSGEEVRSPTVTVDFCQEMTEKCTTEEQQRNDFT